MRIILMTFLLIKTIVQTLRLPFQNKCSFLLTLWRELPCLGVWARTRIIEPIHGTQVSKVFNLRGVYVKLILF